MTIERVPRFLLVATAALATACTAATGPATPAVAEPPLAGVFQVGRTGILCVKEPCPWRGIIHREAATRWPLWRKDELPALEADAETRRRLQRAWDEYGCLLARGTFDGTKLTVERIVGNC